MYYPQPLKPGSRIAICAFSSSVPSVCFARLDKAIELLHGYGFEVVEGGTVRNSGQIDPHTRADELTQFLLDEQVSAVVPPWGGELAMTILPLLDWQALENASPKWVFGFSDVSTIMTALTTRLGWATLHGSNLMQLSALQTDSLTRNTLDIMSLQQGDEITQYPSTFFEKTNSQSISDPTMIFNLTEPTKWRLLAESETKLVPPVIFSGRLLGGCLDTHQHLMQTAFAQLDTFVCSHENDALILYFENAQLNDNAYIRALLGLKFRGVFERASGILIGRNTANDGANGTHKAVLERALGELNIPIVFDVDISHQPPNMPLINGAHTEVKLLAKRVSVTQHLI
ncbi:S66 peptidase family protein [Pseudoalteromonas sp. MMG005]|uniref:S66 family peptidase n=1 Tax=Pseudoalteromonas sp. MMG005 TaxID=2822682 RepID=UPI001B3A09A9|nr:S66 peptidase family protein [Pseudoalteromonas sp. MMG005]MBQ4844591.1 LD-carboxypeptidase [Pseudoalteromonas sp. MMG005]